MGLGPKTGFDFGHAILHLKTGNRVARAGWNGKGMWLMLIEGDGETMLVDSNGKELGYYAVSDAVAMKTAGGDLQPGWLASQADMLAEDWEVVG